MTSKNSFLFKDSDFIFYMSTPSLSDIEAFESETQTRIPPDLLYLFKMYGRIKHNYKNRYYFSGYGYEMIMLDSIVDLDRLKIMYQNFWKETVFYHPFLKSKYLPLISTYSPNINFLIGTEKANLNEIFFHNMDFEKFDPLRVAPNIYEFYNTKTTQS